MVKKTQARANRWRGVFRVMRYFPHAGVVLVVVLGTWGYHLCWPGLPLHDAFYKALQFFALADSACVLQPEWPFHFARFLAPLLVFLAVIRLVFMPFWTWVKLFWQAMICRSRRNILIGYGALNQEIARELAARNRPMTIVAREFDGAARAFAATSRAILLERDLRNAGAMDWLWLGQAQRIVIACGDDSLTLELAQLISDQYRHKTEDRQVSLRKKLPGWLHWLVPVRPTPEDVIHAHFTSTEMHRQLLRARDWGLRRQRRFSVFSIREETARFLFSRAWLVERALSAGQERLHVVVVGGGDLGLAITREALQHGCSVGLGPPLITVVDRDTKATEGRFRAAMPQIFDETLPDDDRPEFDFVACKAEEMKTETAQKLPPVTAWVICCPEDAMNLALAMQLETAMQQGQIAPAPIYPRQWQGSVHNDVRMGLGQQDPLHLVAPFGGMPDVVPTLAFLDRQLLDMAKGINAEYNVTYAAMDEKSPYAATLKTYGPPPWGKDEGPPDAELRKAIVKALELDRLRFLGEWDSLSQEARLSNLAPAQQAALRLWELGFDWKGRHAGVLPRVQENYIAKKVGYALLSDPKSNARLLAVAAAEHRRWMTDRALRGWSAAEPDKRSNTLRLHPNFQGFDDLRTEKERHGKDLREFDVSTLRGILATLMHAETDVVARLPNEAPAVSLLADAEIKAEGRLTLLLPPGADAEALGRGVARVRTWVARDRSFSVRLRPETPAALGEMKAEALQHLTGLHDAALGHGVHLWLELPDARPLRLDIARDKTPAAAPQEQPVD